MEARAAEGLEVCRAAGEQFWVATALNLLAEASLHAGQAGDAAARAGQALAAASKAADRWNEGYALGTMAAAAGQRGDLREARRLAEAALAVMRDIDQQWGAARTLLGLADLARLTGDTGAAQRQYTGALAILREVSARPEIARCLAGLGRIAIDQGELTLAHQYLTESIGLSRAMGNRIGIIRGLEAFTALAAKLKQPDRAVRLAAAAAALRQAAQLPPRPAARTERMLAPARSLGPDAVARLWAEGSALEASSAVDLALAVPPAATGDGGAAASATSPGGLTPRERQIAALIAQGHSNKVIAQELVISPAASGRASPTRRYSLPRRRREEAGLAEAAQGFTPGILSPTEILVIGPGVTRQRAALGRLQRSLAARRGVAGVLGPADFPGLQQTLHGHAMLASSGQAVRYVLIQDSDPLGPAAIGQVSTLRKDLPSLAKAAGLTGVRLEVGGESALAGETIHSMNSSLWRIGLVICTVILVLLAIFLRALLAPLYLLAASALALLCALGLTTWIFQDTVGYGGLVFYVPFAVAVLLISLGSDYNIFVVGRIWEEARRRPLRESVAAAMPRASRAITTAALALAAGFAMLALVPLAQFREIAVAMVLGILIDAFAVRALLVPALVVLAGRAGLWPGRHYRERGQRPVSLSERRGGEATGRPGQQPPAA